VLGNGMINREKIQWGGISQANIRTGGFVSKKNDAGSPPSSQGQTGVKVKKKIRVSGGHLQGKSKLMEAPNQLRLKQSRGSVVPRPVGEKGVRWSVVYRVQKLKRGGGQYETRNWKS